MSKSSVEISEGIDTIGNGVKVFSYSAPHLVLRDKYFLSTIVKN